MNNRKFNDYFDVIYPTLQIDAPNWANYLHLEFDEESKLFTRLHDKHDDFDFPVFSILKLSSDIP